MAAVWHRLINMGPRGRRQPTSSVFGCLTVSPLMLNALLPGHSMLVAWFVKTKKMNINVIQTESFTTAEGGRQSKRQLAPMSGCT